MLDEHAADAGIDPGTGKVITKFDRFQAALCCTCVPPPLISERKFLLLGGCFLHVAPAYSCLPTLSDGSTSRRCAACERLAWLSAQGTVVIRTRPRAGCRCEQADVDGSRVRRTPEKVVNQKLTWRWLRFWRMHPARRKIGFLVLIIAGAGGVSRCGLKGNRLRYKGWGQG